MEKIGNEESTAKRIHYLPHQAVIRKDAETTKVRVVFDASAKERKSGVSLNQCLHVGPSLVPIIYDVLFRIREHKVVFFGDIKQAFLNVEVATEDRDAMYFLWVDNVLGDDLHVVPYRPNRVIFGAGPNPFLLTGTIRHHYAKYSEVDPDFVEKVKNGFFVDDLASGARTVGEEFELYLKTKGRMAEGGFIMRKWKTNSTQLMEEIQEAEMGRGTVEDQEKDASYVQQNSGDHLGSPSWK